MRFTRRAFCAVLGLAGATPVSANKISLRIFGKGAIAPLVPAIAYSQAMGATDANGFVISFPLRSAVGSTARAIFVNTATGNDSNNGLSPTAYKLNGAGTFGQYDPSGLATGYTTTTSDANGTYGPVATLKQALSLVPQQYDSAGQPGEGHQIFLCEGQTFIDPGGYYLLQDRMGYNPTFPFCLQSYSPSDPLNLSKHGRALGANRPTINMVNVSGVAVKFLEFFQDTGRRRSGYVFRGLRLLAANGGDVINTSCSPSYILWENCFFDSLTLQLDHGQPYFSTVSVVRRCSFKAPFNVGRSGGLHSGDNAGVVVEDCVFDRGGWDVTRSRSLPAANTGATGSPGGADIYTHNYYGSATGIDQIKVRRCISSRPAATSFSMRGSSQVTDNVSLFAPIATTMAGWSTNPNVEAPNGSVSNHDRNFSISADDIAYVGLLVNSVPPNGETMVVGSTTYTFVSNGTTPVGNQIAVGTDTPSTAAAIAARLTMLQPATRWLTVATLSKVYIQPIKTGDYPVALNNSSSSAVTADYSNWLPRGNGYNITNTRPGSTITYNLLVNSQRYGKSSTNFITIGDYASYNGVATAFVDYNRILSWTDVFQNNPNNATQYITDGGHNILSATSPATNEQIAVAVGNLVGQTWATFDDAFDYILAHPEISWAALFQKVGAQLFGHTFYRSNATQPAIITPASLSTNSPVVGTAITATPATFDVGSIAIMQWFRGYLPIPGTRGQTTYTPVSADVGYILTFGGFVANGDAESTGFMVETTNTVKSS